MKVLVYIGTSLDGFIARTNGGIDWLVQFANDEAIDSYMAFMSGVDAVVMGRGSFEKVLSLPFWPYDKPVFVLSSSITKIPDNLADKVTVLSLSPHELIVHLSKKGISGIYIDGGKVIQSFLREDLVDELTISKAPILIGSGIPLFDILDQDISFKHMRTLVQSNGLVRSYYERK